jgi:hypothetical protein
VKPVEPTIAKPVVLIFCSGCHYLAPSYLLGELQATQGCADVALS